MLLWKWNIQRHNICEHSTINKTITYTHGTRIRSNITKVQTPIVGPPSWRTNSNKRFGFYAWFQKQKNVIWSKMIYSAGNTTTILVKLVICRSFCLDIYSMFYYNHYMQQLANTQAFPRWGKKPHKSNTYRHLQRTSETVFLSVKYAFKING